jgi:hypothetical protein
MIFLKKTIVYSSILALFILITEFNAMPTNPGSGFDLLLYEPFYLAFPLLIACLFIYINRSFVNVSDNKKIINSISLVIYALVFSIFWTATVFLVLIQVHLSLGGIL